MLTFFITVFLLLTASACDIKDRIIPNVLTLPMIPIGLFLSGFPLTWESIERFVWVIVFFLIGYIRIMGMGDLKLIMAVICLRGIQETSAMFFVGTLLLFVYCLATETETTIRSFKDLYYMFFYHTGMIQRSSKKYPFAAFLAVGYFLVVLVRWFLC